MQADKYQTVLQVDTVNLGGHSQAYPNYPKQVSQEVRDKVDFLWRPVSRLYKSDVLFLKVFWKLILLFLMGLARNDHLTWLNLQYLCDILKKKSGMKSMFPAIDPFLF